MCKSLRVLANNSVLLQTAQASISRPDKQETGTQYDQVIKEQLEGGVAGEVQQDQVLEPGNVHYLLHRGVVRLDRDTAKVRVVYDASSKVFGPSLNACRM